MVGKHVGRFHCAPKGATLGPFHSREEALGRPEWVSSVAPPVLTLPPASPQNMVMSFRVSDLQMLLGFVGRSKSGLKHELVTRALQLVQFDCSPELFKKIKELYETRYAKKQADPGPPQQPPPPPPPQPGTAPPRPLDGLAAVHAAAAYEREPRAGAGARTPLAGPNLDFPVLYGKYLNGLSRLPKAPKPEVRLVKLPFFNMLDELLKPTELGEQARKLGVEGREGEVACWREEHPQTRTHART